MLSDCCREIAALGPAGNTRQRRVVRRRVLTLQDPTGSITYGANQRPSTAPSNTRSRNSAMHKPCSQSEDLRNRFSSATSDNCARPTLRARTAVLGSECPQPKCKRRTRSTDASRRHAAKPRSVDSRNASNDGRMPVRLPAPCTNQVKGSAGHRPARALPPTLQAVVDDHCLHSAALPQSLLAASKTPAPYEEQMLQVHAATPAKRLPRLFRDSTRSYLALLVTLLLFNTPHTVASDALKIKIGRYSPTDSTLAHSLTNFTRALQEQTDNAVVPIFIPLSGSPGELPHLLETGIVDMSLAPRWVIPTLDVTYYPFLISGNEQLRRAIPSLPSEILPKHIEILDSWYSGNKYVISNKELRHLSAFADLPILSSGKPSALFSRWIGATPISIPFAEFWTVSRDWDSLPSVQAIQASSIAIPDGKYLIPTNHLPSSQLLLANKSFLQSMPDELSTILRRLSVDIGRENDHLIYEKETSALAAFSGEIIWDAVPSLRKIITTKELDEIDQHTWNVWSVGGNGCTKVTECKCKSGDYLCKCSASCKTNNNCK